ncbi:RNA polymerase sigma factor [Flexivirga oryzae]|uniref:RNA polymerase sigma factor (Sigma-70 family) n=1 Tax=Flexivirga oryzae TaxID=1794944 RepID=A0A839N8V7_9MICO|nr:sigma-70 family RNA polymerase sigma factor [Flexivirga oryzae]MBB2893239.1 RNA polymerase sigma factor (sigma-70 family) [Flexivirga oryzae]
MPALTRLGNKPPDVSPGDLVAGCAAGEQACWDELMRRYGRLVYGVARRYRLTSAECDDVAQATWLRLVQRITTLRNPDSVGDWLATVARNESLRVITRERRAIPMAEPIEAMAVATTGDPERAALVRSELAVLRVAMEQLSSRDQHLLRLVLRDPAPTYQQISDETGIPVASIGPTRTRCLRKLRAAMSELGVERPSACPVQATAGSST